ncbi:hypothetical protein PR048_027745 [Dryococelus australis]|uniref:Uncharacterized protein n=1 Tax=Dryococelus australis TaxID=614101 RepID=A0ABQ9GHD4_9NEOP|nr:hypothetical protein PR048_027745 [Dryococelus australis]
MPGYPLGSGFSPQRRRKRKASSPGSAPILNQHDFAPPAIFVTLHGTLKPDLSKIDGRANFKRISMIVDLMLYMENILGVIVIIDMKHSAVSHLASAELEGGNGRSPRKPADRRHRTARFLHAEIRERPVGEPNPVHVDMTGSRKMTISLTASTRYAHQYHRRGSGSFSKPRCPADPVASSSNQRSIASGGGVTL